MALYLYRCDEHGISERSLPMGMAERQVACPSCGSPAARVFTAPRLSLGDPARRALIDRTERTRDEPAVVSSPGPRPARRAAPVATNPALRRLPRP
ncbi:zinc ribbon domain-containing protein [Blastococcus montanus]|uniref:zinc ribbon domain-containing protein n=1 Tax=Blastococcus montanus TaxID=3144973 RepID=UPI00320AC00E